MAAPAVAKADRSPGASLDGVRKANRANAALPWVVGSGLQTKRPWRCRPPFDRKQRDAPGALRNRPIAIIHARTPYCYISVFKGYGGMKWLDQNPVAMLKAPLRSFGKQQSATFTSLSPNPSVRRPSRLRYATYRTRWWYKSGGIFRVFLRADKGNRNQIALSLHEGNGGCNLCRQGRLLPFSAPA